MTEYDSPWKEVMTRFFPAFLSFFYPDIHDEIDWSRGYETLDKELQQIVRGGELGRSLADMLFRVWKKSGEEDWVLAHLEVQAQEQANFSKRMFIYRSRIVDRYNKKVASLAVLADDNPNWRPQEYRDEMWGTGVVFTFRPVKLLDWNGSDAPLEQNPNPFAVVVLAHLKSRETRGDDADRRNWKFRLVRGLFQRNVTPEQVRELFRFIDWVLDLPDPVNDEFLDDVYKFEQENNMTYISYAERRGEERGEKRGVYRTLLRSIEVVLKLRYQEEGLSLMDDIRQIDDMQILDQIFATLETAASIDEIKQLVAEARSKQPSDATG